MSVKRQFRVCAGLVLIFTGALWTSAIARAQNAQPLVSLSDCVEGSSLIRAARRWQISAVRPEFCPLVLRISERSLSQAGD
jgi:hypothetical protein